MRKVQAPQVQEKHINPDNQRRRPETRDNLDHRSGEEQDDKGEHTTHNKKEHHTAPQKKK